MPLPFPCMSKHEADLTLAQLIEFCNEAIEFVSSESLQDLQTDRIKQRAFERIMECIGEAVKRLPSDVAAKYPEIPWTAIAGMRDRIAHGYDSIEHSVLWNAAKNDIPVLLETCTRESRQDEAL